MLRDAWVAQSVEHQTLDFSPGHEIETRVSSVHSMESARESLSLPCPLPLPHPFLSKNNNNNKSKIKETILANFIHCDNNGNT